MNRITRYWQQQPTYCHPSFLAGIPPAGGNFFQRFLGMHDDHFLVIEASQSWVDGTDYNNWLPKNAHGQASGHSWLYPRQLHYFLLKFLQAIGIMDAQGKMYLVRAVHAGLSLLSIWWAYKIVEKKSTKETANLVGIVLGLLWFMPFMSVRNLVEFVCITPLMAAMWLLVRQVER